MNTWLAIAAIAVTCAFFVWILTRQAAQQRAGTLHHPEDEQLRKDADTRDEATWSHEIPWRDGQAPPAQSPPAVAAPDAITTGPVLPPKPEAEAEAEGEAGAGTGAEVETGAQAGTGAEAATGVTTGAEAGVQAQDGHLPAAVDREADEAEPSGPGAPGTGRARTGSSRVDASRTGA